jgi:hypothetical protein
LSPVLEAKLRVEPDLHEFEVLSRRAPKKCVVVRRIEALKPEDQEKVTAALAAEHISHNAIRTWLTQKGQRCNDDAIKRHRRQDCCCER